MSSLLLLNSSCDDRSVGIVDPNPVGEQIKEIAIGNNRNLDVLFVIDNASSMETRQQALSRGFGAFIDELEVLGAGRPNLHIGVISSDLGAGPYSINGCDANGDTGALQNTPRIADCTAPTDRFIVDIQTADGERQKNYQGTISESFSCIAELGTNGCRFGQPLEAMFRALNNSNPVRNDGFIRSDANLAIIIVTDQDDCSVEDLSMFNSDTRLDNADSQLGYFSEFRCFEFGVVCDPDSPRTTGERQNCEPRTSSPYMHDIGKYSSFLRSLKQLPLQITVASIVGPSSNLRVVLDSSSKPTLAPSCCAGQDCDSKLERYTRPAVRIDSFLSEFQPRATATSLCSDDWRDSLRQIARSAAQSLGTPCIDGDLRLSEGQPICTVSERLSPSLSEERIGECDSGTTTLPCYHFDVDTARCDWTPTSLALSIERGGAVPPPNSTLVARCEVL